MAHLKWNQAIFFLLICIPITLLLWCLKYCCRDEDEDEDNSARRRTPSPTRSWSEYQNRSASYLPRQSQLGFAVDINEQNGSTPYRPVHPSNGIRNQAPYPTEAAASYPISNTIPQPSNTGTHAVAPYPLSNISPMPLPPPADEPPSYEEATQNK